MDDLFSLAGRTALVTGGSRGIGRMIAAGFLAQGARVYVSSRKAEACAETAAELSAAGECLALPADVSTMAGVAGLAADFSARESKLDILVNNAGVAWGAPFEDFPEIGWDKVMNLNVKTPFFLTQKLFPMLKAGASPQQLAKVINIASIDGMKLNPWDTYSYHASKAAVLQLTRRMAVQLIRDNIVCTAIAPGAFASEMNKAAANNADVVSKGIPSGRIGDALDMAGGAIYLASRAGDYVVGTTLTVDGGVNLVR